MTRSASSDLLTDAERRCVARWAVACAGRALPIFEELAPLDARPRRALAAADAYAAGGLRNAALRESAWEAYAAARDVGDEAAAAAARAAGLAAASAYLHAQISAHQLVHVLGPAAYAARAREQAAGGDAAVGDAEVREAVARAGADLRTLVRRFPARTAARSRLDVLYARLDACLRR